MRINSFKVALAALLLSTSSAAYSVTQVDIELQLLLDISGSIDSSEYDLQLLGYQAAFESDNVQNAIINGSEGQIAVQLIMWSGPNQQSVMIDWTLVDSAASADTLAADIAAIARPFSGWTAIGEAIEYAYPLFEDNGFEGFDQIMDISGDGTNNSGVAPGIASDNAIADGVDTINGIVITTNQNVVDQYLDDVVNGETPFLLAPGNFDDFQTSIENKIIAEISGTSPTGAITVPEPGTLGLFAIPAVFMCFRKRTIKEKKS
jgi:hypothetical protein